MKIVRVGALDNDMVDIQLDNGNIVLLNMELKRLDPAYAQLWQDDLVTRPRTDGTRVFWDNPQSGPSVTLEEILAMLRMDATQ